MKTRLLLFQRSGFTLFETLVALTVLSVAVAVVVQLYSANLRALSSSEEQINASMKAEAKMREILLQDALSPGRWDEMGDDGYRYAFAISEVLAERTENLPVKLMHVHLSVSWKSGRKEKSIELTTMKVSEKES